MSRPATATASAIQAQFGGKSEFLLLVPVRAAKYRQSTCTNE